VYFALQRYEKKLSERDVGAVIVTVTRTLIPAGCLSGVTRRERGDRPG